MEEIFVCEQERKHRHVWALWFLSTTETVVFRFIFRAFEVRERCRDAARAAATLEMGQIDLSSSCVCVFGHGHAQIILTEFKKGWGVEQSFVNVDVGKLGVTVYLYYSGLQSMHEFALVHCFPSHFLDFFVFLCLAD